MLNPDVCVYLSDAVALKVLCIRCFFKLSIAVCHLIQGHIIVIVSVGESYFYKSNAL